jgi:hypothetical protein
VIEHERLLKEKPKEDQLVLVNDEEPETLVLLPN